MERVELPMPEKNSCILAIEPKFGSTTADMFGETIPDGRSSD